MHLKKFRWSKVYESSEEELVTLLGARNIEGQPVHAEAGSELVELDHETAVMIWCAEGSLSLKTVESTTSLQPGDAIRINAATSYSLFPGMAGCVYYLTR